MKKRYNIILIACLILSIIITPSLSYASELTTCYGWGDGWDYDDDNDDGYWNDDDENDDWWNDKDDDYSEPEPTLKPTINRTTLGLGKKSKYTLKVSNATSSIKWSSSNKKVATVSKKGVVTGKKAGSATIKASMTGTTLKCKVTIYNGGNPESIRKKILKLKKKYPEGKRWTNNNSYYWRTINTYCYGCIGFVAIASDKAFGKKKKTKTHHNFSKIKSGDHIRIGDYHSVIVLEKNGNTLTVAEGNYNSSIHWGRKIKKSELTSSGFYVQTRY